MHETTSTLYSELADYRDRFAIARQEAAALVDGLSPDALNTAPSPEAWSVGQCLAHLNESTGQLVPRLETAIDRARDRGPFAEGPFRYGMVSRWFIHAMDPEAGWTFPAPNGYAPPAIPLEPAEVLGTFQALQDRLIACAERADGLDLKRIRVASPLTRLVRLSLGAWLAATAAHQERHLQQAERTRQALEA